MRAPHLLAPALVLITLLLAPMTRADDFDATPWSLRDHFSFTMGASVMDYAVENGEWRLHRDGVEEIIQKVDMAIHLASGQVITTRDLRKGKVVRKNFDNGGTRGIQYTITFAPVHGAIVKHAMSVHSGFPHMLIDVSVASADPDHPVEVVSIMPVVIPAGNMAWFSAATTYTPRRLDFRGGTPMFSRQSLPQAAWFEDSTQNMMLAFAVLPHGVATTGADFAFANGQWQGVVASRFDPPVRVEAGQSLASDTVWLCFALPTSDDLDTLLSWSHSERPRREGVNRPPTSWASATPGTPLDRLIESAGGWTSAGLRHVLVPSGWEGRPGSLEGGGGYPRNMERAASQLRSAGLTPGITVDPLTGPQGDGAWSVLSADGQRWLNLSTPGGRAAAAANIRTVASWGFEFVAIEPSRIPTEVLKTFNLTRAQADHLAFEVAQEAAGAVPVVPTPADTLGLSLADWEEADAASRRLMEYRLPIGPVRLELRGNEELTPELVEAIKEYSGAIEVVGHPRRSLLTSLRGVFPRNNFSWDVTAALDE